MAQISVTITILNVEKLIKVMNSLYGEPVGEGDIPLYTDQGRIKMLLKDTLKDIVAKYEQQTFVKNFVAEEIAE